MAYGHTSPSPHTDGGDELLAGRGGTDPPIIKWYPKEMVNHYNL